MKVLVVTKDLSGKGGVVSYYRLFQSRFSEPDIELEFFCVGSRFKDYEQRNNRRFAYLGELFRDLKTFRRRLREERDIEIVQLSPSLIPVALVRDALFLVLARLARRKTVVFFRGWREKTVQFLEKHRLVRTVFKSVFFKADCCCVLASRFGEPLLRWGLPPEKLLVSYTAFDGAMTDKTEPFSGKRDIPRFIFISRVSGAKGVDDIVEAAGLLKKQNRSFTVDLYGHVGDWDFYHAMERRVKELALEGCVTFHDYIDGEEKYAALNRADVFLLPSWFEGCPNSVIEAMSMGNFIVATPVGAIPEIVREDSDGVMVKLRDSRDLAEKMARCIDDIGSIRAKREAIRLYAHEHYEIGVFTKQFADLYRRLSGKNSVKETKKCGL